MEKRRKKKKKEKEKEIKINKFQGVRVQDRQKTSAKSVRKKAIKKDL